MADQKDVRDLPSPLGVDFDLPRSKKGIFFNFLMKISHFGSIFAGLQGGPLMPEIPSSNKSSKIYLYEGRTLKPATFDPPHHRSQNPAWQGIFKASMFENALPSQVLGSRIWGVKCCWFLGAPLVYVYFARLVAGGNFWHQGASLQTCKNTPKMRNFH